MPAGQAAEAAASVLADAWKPPCLRYTPAYMAWQLGFPGEVQPVAVLAFSGAEAVGCAASTPRRVRLHATDREVHLVSFVAVRPVFRGHGLAPRLYDALLERLRLQDTAIVTFAQPGGAGQRVLEEAYPRAGFALKPLAPHHVFAYRDRGEPAAAPPSVEADPLVLDEIVDGCRGGTVLWAAPSRPERAQLGRGPHPGAFLVARGPGNAVRGGAFATRTEAVTLQGLQAVPAIDTFFLPAGSAEDVREHLAAAARLFPEAGPTVTTAALAALAEPAALPRALVRRMPASFNAWVGSPRRDDPLLEATATTLAVA